MGLTEKPLIIKFGGSVVTDKSSFGVIDHKEIAALATALSSVPSPVVLIHGAGSRGHPQAKKWHLVDGVSRENAIGIYETHVAVSSLNSDIVSALRAAGINAVSFPPFASSLAEGKRLVYAGEQQISLLLSAGIMPVLFGDTVMDTKQGVCIVSGDQFVSYLSRALCAQRVGIVTSAGGVLHDGNVVPCISRKNLADISFSATDCADVTGGMKGKVDELISLAEYGIDSYIFAPEKLTVFLAGKNPGTWITHD